MSKYKKYIWRYGTGTTVVRFQNIEFVGGETDNMYVVSHSLMWATGLLSHAGRKQCNLMFIKYVV